MALLRWVSCCLRVRRRSNWYKETAGRLKMQCVFSGREAVRGGRQFELEGRQKEAGRGWKRQRMGRKDRWMWSDAGTTPDTWHRNREGFHTFHSKLSFSVNLSVSRPGVALENTHFSHSCRSRRQYCHCFDVQEKAGGEKNSSQDTLCAQVDNLQADKSAFSLVGKWISVDFYVTVFSHSWEITCYPYGMSPKPLTIYSVSIWKRCNICTKAGRWWTNLSQSRLGRATIWFAKFWFASLASFQIKASSLLVLKQMFSIKRKPCAIPVWSAGFAHLLMIKCQKCG